MNSQHLKALDVLQTHLARLYRVDGFAPVSSYVVGPSELERMSATGALTPRPGAREEVFVLDDGHEVNVAVYLDERSQAAAAHAVNGDEVSLSEDNFADFCVALEGVSHFLLVNHRAIQDRPVTQLELELQAEVDKYLMARLCPWEVTTDISDVEQDPMVTLAVTTRTQTPAPSRLQRALFESYSLAEHLGNEQVERYKTASRFAHRYCKRIESQFLKENSERALRQELQAFFRKSQAERLQHIG